MSDINVQVLTGRLTRDAETRSAGGTPVASFSIANNYYSKVKDNAVNFFEVEQWNPGGVLQYLKKGQQVAIHGELRQDRWEHEGKPMSRIKIISHHIQLLGGGKRDGAASGSAQGAAPSDAANDDIPF